VKRLDEDEAKAIIRNIYRAIINEDYRALLSFFSKDATVSWDSFIFHGHEGIRKWGEELRQIFPWMRIVETQLHVEEEKVTHEFVMWITVPDGRKGRLPVRGEYQFKGANIQSFVITLSMGILVFDMDEAQRLGLDIPNRTPVD
jgi:hypothetical protein